MHLFCFYIEIISSLCDLLSNRCFIYLFAVTPPAQRVQSLLGLDPKEQVHETHPLFSEMAELIHNAEGEMEWHETAR